MLKRFFYVGLAYLRRFRKSLALLISALITHAFFITRKNMEPDRKAVKSIIVFGDYGIGDAILTFPLISTLKANFPESKITIATSPTACLIYKSNNNIDEIIEFPPRDFNFFQRMRFLKDLAKKKYDLIFDDIMKFDSLVFAALSLNKGNLRCDRGSLRLHQIFKKKGIYHHQIHRHRSEVQLDTLSMIGIRNFKRDIHLKIDKTQVKKAAAFFNNSGIRKNDFIVTLHPGAALKIKCWAEKSFAYLARFLVDQYKAKIILLGSKDEIRKSQRIQSLSGRELIIAAGKCDIDAVIGIIKNSNIFIGNDSGPSNIASALGIPTLTIFGPGNPQIIIHGLNTHFIENVVDCQKPCFYIRAYADFCPKNNKCLDISVDQVLEKVESIIRNDIN